MNIDFDKMGGLVPAIIQDSYTSKVLMLGFMNAEALQKTQELGKVTFFSRTKNRLWTKGEESGNFLLVDSIKEDCDRDTLLIKVRPVGPVCHTGSDTCFDEKNVEDIMFLKYLQDFIDRRKQEMPEGSYTTSLFNKGINGSKSGGRSCRDCYRSNERYGRPVDIRGIGFDISLDSVTYIKRI